jgi:CRP/FNR family transcriptional regulator, cyclic AMP receptor protein
MVHYLKEALMVDLLPDEENANHFDEAVKLKKDQVLFVEGESSAYLYIVVKGKIRIIKETDSKLIPISVIGNKSFLGELSMFSDDPRSASAVALEPSEVIMIKKSEIRKVIKDCPPWISEIMQTLCDRLRGGLDILREHNIVDGSTDEDNVLTQEQSNSITESIKAYRTRRGLSL